METLTVKEKGLLTLYKTLEDEKLYVFAELRAMLMDAGASIQYATLLIQELEHNGVLERVRRGVYKVNKQKLTRLVKRYGLIR